MAFLLNPYGKDRTFQDIGERNLEMVRGWQNQDFKQGTFHYKQYWNMEDQFFRYLIHKKSTKYFNFDSIMFSPWTNHTLLYLIGLPFKESIKSNGNFCFNIPYFIEIVKLCVHFSVSKSSKMDTYWDLSHFSPTKHH